MREIKFRAWNEDEDRWATCDEFSQVKINPTLDQFGGGSVGADLQNMAAVEVGTGNLVLMHYTGLHDCKGTPIYEGDIIKASLWEECGLGVIEWKDDHACFGIQWAIDGGGWWGLGSVTDMKVIGNIHQHPDLIRKDT